MSFRFNANPATFQLNTPTERLNESANQKNIDDLKTSGWAKTLWDGTNWDISVPNNYIQKNKQISAMKGTTVDFIFSGNNNSVNIAAGGGSTARLSGAGGNNSYELGFNNGQVFVYGQDGNDIYKTMLYGSDGGGLLSIKDSGGKNDIDIMTTSDPTKIHEIILDTDEEAAVVTVDPETGLPLDPKTIANTVDDTITLRGDYPHSSNRYYNVPDRGYSFISTGAGKDVIDISIDDHERHQTRVVNNRDMLIQMGAGADELLLINQNPNTPGKGPMKNSNVIAYAGEVHYIDPATGSKVDPKNTTIPLENLTVVHTDNDKNDVAKLQKNKATNVFRTSQVLDDNGISMTQIKEFTNAGVLVNEYNLAGFDRIVDQNGNKIA